MSQEQHTHNLRMALDEALRYNDDIARQVDKLETEISSDFACGLWRFSQMQTDALLIESLGLCTSIEKSDV